MARDHAHFERQLRHTRRASRIGAVTLTPPSPLTDHPPTTADLPPSPQPPLTLPSTAAAHTPVHSRRPHSRPPPPTTLPSTAADHTPIHSRRSPSQSTAAAQFIVTPNAAQPVPSLRTQRSEESKKVFPKPLLPLREKAGMRGISRRITLTSILSHQMRGGLGCHFANTLQDGSRSPWAHRSRTSVSPTRHSPLATPLTHPHTTAL